MPPTPKPGSLNKDKVVKDKVVKDKPVKKDAQPGSSAWNKEFANKAVADSAMIYYKKFLKLQGSTIGNPASDKAWKDLQRQRKIGQPGYDKNGFPIKKSKVGGAVKSKIKSKKK
jgi:hypothetical protein